MISSTSPLILKATAVLILIVAVVVQLRLVALNLSPISFVLPDLPSLSSPCSKQLGNVLVEKVGENDLLYPEAIVVDTDGWSAFVSLGDGRIVQLKASVRDWDELAWRTVVRTGDPGGDALQCGSGGPSDKTNMESKCGRPLGLLLAKRSSVDPTFTSAREGEMFLDDDIEDVLLVADAYRGLLMVTDLHGRNEAKVTILATRAESDPLDYKFSLLNGIVQTRDGDIYVTETSQKFQRRRIFHAAMDGSPTGRLLRFRRRRLNVKREFVVEAVADKIYMPNGITLSHDGRSLLIVSGVSILRYDLSTERMGEHPFVEVMPGTGDNIKAMSELPNGTKKKCYWAALGGKYVQPFSLIKFVSNKPWLRSLLLAIVPYRKIIDLVPKWTALAVYDEQGKLLEMLWDDGKDKKEDENGKIQEVGVTAPWISEIEPLGDYLYLLSWYNPFLARIKRSCIIGKQESRNASTNSKKLDSLQR